MGNCCAGRPPEAPALVILSSVTAEEQGLLGSEYLGQHPPFPQVRSPLTSTSTQLPPIGTPLEVNVNGAQRTTFYPNVEATAKRFNLTIVPDPRPEAGSYYRSDHFSLSRVGIPAFSTDAGTLWEGHDHAWGVAQEKDYNDNRYPQLQRQLHTRYGLPRQRQTRTLWHGSRLASYLRATHRRVAQRRRVRSCT